MTPGSPFAKSLGCTCPAAENHGGLGEGDYCRPGMVGRMFCIDDACLMHGAIRWQQLGSPYWPAESIAISLMPKLAEAGEQETSHG